MWGIVQLAISELDFDFAAYARSTSNVSPEPPPTDVVVSALQAL